MSSDATRGFIVPALLAVIAVAVVAGGLWYYFRVEKEARITPVTGSAVRPLTSPLPLTSAAPRSAPSTVSFTGTRLAGTVAPLIDFNPADFAAAQASDKLIVLYFYANWCPICAEEVPMLEAAFNQLTTPNVVGFRVNYNDDQTDDAETALAREQGVIYQHTKVFIKNGQRQLFSLEPWDTARYISEITAAAP